MKRIKLLIPTVVTGIIIGLVALLVWSASFRMVPAKTVSESESVSRRTAIGGRQMPIKNQFFLTEQVQAFILPATQTNYLPIRDFNIAEPEMAAKAAGLYDIGSGKFLYAKNIDEKLPIASVTKLMTAVVVMENLPLNDSFTVYAEDLNADGEGSDFLKGEILKGSDLLKIMLINSSNDAALVFASNAAAQKIDLVAKMNEKAQFLNMRDTNFIDPAGLNDNGSYSTVSDLIKLANYIDKYPVIWEILSTRSADVRSVDGVYPHHLASTNKLLDVMPGIIGGKTGFTNAALETMVLEVRVGDNDRIIAVVLGSLDRFGEIKKLIEWSQSAFSWKR